jgi:hypothetical protein
LNLKLELMNENIKANGCDVALITCSCTDENGNKYGWGLVLDYIGVPWRDDPFEPAEEQLSMFDMEDNQ